MLLRWFPCVGLVFLASACHVYEAALLDAAADRAVIDASADATQDANDVVSEDVAARADAPDAMCATSCSGACVDLQTDPHHCGDCSTDCTALAGVIGTAVRCVAGVCDVSGACAPGRAHCSANASDGCEADVTTAMQCGQCGHACPASAPLCAMATDGGVTYACASGCSVGTIPCGMTCTDPQTDPNNCGSCGHPCPSGVHGTPSCMAASCALVCDTGFGNCDTSLANGCERDLTADVNNCGACGNVCPTPAHGTAACAGSTCGVTCDPGFDDCDSSAANGCETTLASSPANCGSCGNACATIPNGTATCVASVCGATCNAGFTLVGGRCLLPAPRLVAPLSTTTVTRHQPTFHVALPAGADGVRVEICSTRTCSTVLQTIDATGASARATTALAPNAYFWRAYARSGATVVSPASLVWVFDVTAHNTGADTSWGTRPDFNGDGISDVAVAATGDVYVFQGTTGVFPIRPTTTVVAPLGATQFGNAMAGAGDINGDGFGDLVVGAIGSSNVYVYLGSATGIATTPARTLGPPAGAITFGVAVAGVGDVNGDGFGDVVIGASGSGTAYVYQGAALGLATSPAATMTFAATSNGGHAVAGAGDVNGDGVGDVIVGASATNEVRVYLGRPTLGLNTASPISLNGGLLNMMVGRSVGGAGDVDGDGFADVVVGTASNVALVYRGSATGTSTTGTSLIPSGTATGFGIAVDLVPDGDGDGFDEIAVGANGSNAIWFWRGAATLGAGTAITGPLGFGVAVAGAGDVNGDHLGDLVGGAVTAAVAVCEFGAATLPFRTSATLAPLTPPANYGQVVACLDPSLPAPAHRVGPRRRGRG